MKTRFAVLTDADSPEERSAITNSIDETEAGFWHWFQTSWLIADPKGRSAAWWRDHIKEASPTTYLMVVPVDNNADWAGFGKGKMFNWMHETFDKEPGSP